MERVSKGLYLSVVIGGLALGMILMSVGAYNREPVFAIAGVILLLIAVILFYILIYKMWEAIQDGHARTTPGKAVGFLFIPFFNLYWMFPAIAGYAKDYNAYLNRHSVQATPLSEGLFLSYPILTLVSFIPFIGFFVSIAVLVIMVIMVSKICDAINALPVSDASASQAM